MTAPVEHGGLGFTLKWNMGWMHDTLHYMERDPVYRSYEHHLLTFGMVYAYSEKFVLPLSHDEMVHGKGSLIRKMPGDDWQKFANLRAYFGWMWTFPGKKLLFMGSEIAQWAEWNNDGSIDWGLLDHPLHKGMQSLVADLNHLYAEGAGPVTRPIAVRRGSAGPWSRTRRTPSSPSCARPSGASRICSWSAT